MRSCFASLAILLAAFRFFVLPAAAYPPDRATAERGEIASRESTVLQKQGDFLLKQGEINQAIAAYQQSISLRRSNADAYAGLGDAFAAKGQYQEAMDAWRVAVGWTRDPHWGSSRQDDPDLKFRFALLLSNLGRYSEAIQAYQEGVKGLHPNYQSMMNLPLSPRAFNKRQFQAAAYVGMGIKQFGHGDWDGAIAFYDKAIGIAPNFAPAYLERGNALWHGKGMKRSAKSMYRKVLELDHGAVAKKAEEMLGK